MISVTRANTILYCESWAKTVQFYRIALGLPVAFENDWFVEFRVAESSFVSIVDAARASIVSAKGKGITLSWHVSDVDSARELLVAAKVSATPIRSMWNARLFYFYDPEGHRIEIWQSKSGVD
jgi:catechol 2,3-dioxygenase-like lactoylglutathione lyase family enzyme